MNLILLEASDFIDPHRVRLEGRRMNHILQVHRAARGDTVRVGLLDGKLGKGVIDQINPAGMEMVVDLHADPPAPLPVRLILALPRPKVLNRTIAAAASMGIREIDLINAWRVEKAYWSSPRLSDENLRLQSILGLEQAGDTTLPSIRLHKLFAPFVREELPPLLPGRVALLANPGAELHAPRQAREPLVIAIGPEGGFIDREVQTFRDIGFTEIGLGARILRVETALAYLIGRLS
jgi:16S rRNA (uracil1498-N3)-methyltransferase